jgi:hypothetical protein
VCAKKRRQRRAAKRRNAQRNAPDDAEDVVDCGPGRDDVA